MGALRLCPAEGRLQYGAMPLVAQLACTAGSAMQLAPLLAYAKLHRHWRWGLSLLLYPALPVIVS